MLPVGRARVVAAALLLLSACRDGGAAPLERAAPPPGEAARSVPAPADGQLRAVVTPSDDAEGAGDGPAAQADSVVLLFGDSVAVSIAGELAAEIPGYLAIDAVDCRRLDIGFDGGCGGVPAGVSVSDGRTGLQEAIAELAADDIVPDAAVIVIANNSALTAELLDDAMDILDEIPRVWWVTTTVEGRAWRDPNNALLNDTAAAYDNAGLVDWFLHSEGEDWIDDFVHPNGAGQAALAAYIAEHLRCDCTP